MVFLHASYGQKFNDNKAQTSTQLLYWNITWCQKWSAVNTMAKLTVPI